MKKIALLLVAVLFCGCQSMMGFKQEDGAYKIKYDHFSDTHVLVRYYGREYLISDAGKQAAVYNDGYCYIDIELRGHDEARPSQNHFILTDAHNNVLYNDKGVGGAHPVYYESYGSKMTGYGQVRTHNVDTSYQGRWKITLESDPMFPLTLEVEYRYKEQVIKRQKIVISKR